MADKCLTVTDWKSFAKSQKLDDAKEASEDTKALHEAVIEALQELGKRDENKHDDMLAALDRFEGLITKQIAANAKRKDKIGKTIKDVKDVKDQLYKLLAAVEKQRHEVSAAKDAKAQAQDEADSPALLTTRMIPLIREVRKGDLVLSALIALAGKETVVLLSRKAISPARGKLLKEQMSVSSGLKFVRGEALFEEDSLTFVVQAPAAGLAKRIKAALLAQTEMRLKVRVRGEDPNDVDEESEDGAVASLAVGGSTQATSPKESTGPAGPPDAAKLAFAKRMIVLKVEVDKLSVRGDAKAAQLQAMLESARQLVKAGDVIGGNDKLTALEKVLSDAVESGAQPGSAGQAQKRAEPPDAAKLAFAKRMIVLKVQVDKLSVRGDAKAAQLQALLESARQLVKAGDITGGYDELAALEKLMSGDEAGIGPSIASTPAPDGDAPTQAQTADDNHTKAQEARNALPNYLDARAIAAAPPAAGALGNEVQAFLDKESIVTEAEKAGSWTDAQKGHPWLRLAAKTLVERHALWKAYSVAYGPEVESAVEAADAITELNPTALRNEIGTYKSKKSTWSMNVETLEWDTATTAAQELGTAANALVHQHALWELYQRAYSSTIKQSIESAEAIVSGASAELQEEGLSFSEQQQVWSTAVDNRDWTAAAKAVLRLGIDADNLVKKHALWEAYTKVFTLGVKRDVDKAQTVAKANPGELKTEIEAFKPKRDAWQTEVTLRDWEAAATAIPQLITTAKALLEKHDLWVAYSLEYTPTIAKSIEDADAVAALAERQLQKETEPFTAAWMEWSTAVGNRDWLAANNAISEVAIRADALVKKHALWQAYTQVYTPVIQHSVETAAKLGTAAKELQVEHELFNTERLTWMGTVSRGDWVRAAAAVGGLATAAQKLIEQTTDWQAYSQQVSPDLDKDYKAAFALFRKKSPDLVDQSAAFQTDSKMWVGFKTSRNWQKAAGIVDAVHAKAKALIALDKQLASDFDSSFNGDVKVQIEQAADIRTFEIRALLPATRRFATMYNAWDKLRDGSKWTAVTQYMPSVHSAAKIYITAYAEYTAQVKTFDKALKAVANYDAALELCTGKPVPAPKNCPGEVRAFLQAKAALDQYTDQADWVAATQALAPITAVVSTLIPAFSDWKPFGLRSETLAPLLERARFAAANAPARLATQKANFESKANQIGPAVSGRQWTAALDALNASETVAHALVAAQAQYDKERQPFDAAAGPAWAAHAEAAALMRNLPPGIATDPRVVAVTAAESKLKAADQTEDWIKGVDAANMLKSKSAELMASAADLNTRFSETDAQVIPDLLKALEVRTDKAGDAPPLSDHVDILQKEVLAQLAAANDALARKAYVEAGLVYQALLAAVQKMEAAKAAHTVFNEKLNAAWNGPVQAARDLGKVPASLAGVRDAALDRMLKRIEAAARKGQISLATTMVEGWIEGAQGWTAKWETAKDAHAALQVNPPDEARIKALADAQGGGKVFDDLIAGLPDSTPAAVYAAAMKARYGVDLTQYEKQEKDATDLKPMAADKSARKLYKLLTSVPESHVKGPLREIVQYTQDDKGGGHFENTMQRAVLYCGRSEGTSGKKVADLVQPHHFIPEVDEDCKPVDNQQKQFNWIALHEVGHAIDDATKFMNGRRANPKFGGWLSSSAEEAAAAAAEQFGYPKEYIAKVLNNKGKPLPADAPADPNGNPDAWAQAQTAAEAWCAKVVEGHAMWNKAADCTAAAIGGRVYQQAYANQWYSYPLAARNQGIAAYQFRSPGEWMAELYAAYYSGKLKESHPAVSWLKDLRKPVAA